MPNHVTNILKTTCQEALDALKSIDNEGEEVLVDFGAIIPMPEIMKADSSMPKIEDLAHKICADHEVSGLDAQEFEKFVCLLENKDKNDPLSERILEHTYEEYGRPLIVQELTEKEFILLPKYMRALRQYGSCSWYAWSCAHWGTKWGAYEIEKIDGGVKFQTAWSPPMPVIQELSKRFPDAKLEFRWADEDFGCNTGEMVMQNEEMIQGGILENQSPEAYQNAVEIIYNGELPEYYRWTEEGTVEYVEMD